MLFRYIDRILSISLLNNGFKEQMLKQPKSTIIVIQLFFLKNPNFKYVSKVVNYRVSTKVRYLFGKAKHIGPDCGKGTFSLAL